MKNVAPVRKELGIRDLQHPRPADQPAAPNILMFHPDLNGIQVRALQRAWAPSTRW
jgi:hypothetical protein